MIVKHWRVREDKDGWYLLGYYEADRDVMPTGGIFQVRGRIFGRVLAWLLRDTLNSSSGGSFPLDDVEATRQEGSSS